MHNILKVFLLVFFFTSSLSAMEFKDEYIQIVAKDVKSKDNIITANDNVILYSQNYYITASKLIYDKNNSKLELFGNVNISKNNESVLYSEYVFIDVNKEISFIEPSLLVEKQNGLWIKSNIAKREGELYSLDKSSLSSCECVEPDWDIRFSNGDFNRTEQWINTYNTTLYLNDFPVLYTPYFGFSTNKTRRTGLLYPTLGFSSDSGFLYSQPIYYAPQANYDIEFVPTIRTKRGHGLDLTYRLADSAYSMLKINGGYFKDTKSYQETNNLTHDKHQGWSLDYTRTKLFTSDNLENSSKDGMYVKLQDMNDVDYDSVRYGASDTHSVNRYLESRVKYYYDNYKYYADIDNYYYNDLEKGNNDEVLQILPRLNLHKYLDSIYKNLTYSTNVTVERKDRKIGIGATTADISLPIGYFTTFFNDYINLDITQEFKYTNVDFTNDLNKYKSLHYGASTNIVSVYTDLIKQYDSYLHALRFDISHLNENPFYKKGDPYNDSLVVELDQFKIDDPSKTLNITIDQTLYDSQSIQEILSNKITQAYIYKQESSSYEKKYLENELALYFSIAKLSNKTKYDYNIEKVSNSSSALSLSYDRYSMTLNQIFTRDIDTLDIEKTITYNIAVELSNIYSIEYAQEYDMVLKEAKNTQYAFNIDKKCWALSLKFIDSIVATDTLNDKAENEQIVYMELNLKNLFKLNQVFDFD